MLDGLRPDLLELRFRANPALELVPLDRLTPGERRALTDHTLYGLLRPRGACALAPKAIGPDVALLFLTLTETGALPHYARRAMGDAAQATVARLILDEVLEVEVDGRRATGTRARGLLFARETEGDGDPIARLSLAALRYAAQLALPPGEELWMRLYFYNRLPLSPRWQRRFPTPDQVAEILAGPPRGETRRRLDDCFRAVAPDPHNDRWRMFDHLSPRGRIGRDHPRYKLYVSPHPRHVAPAFAAVVTAVAELGAPRFKVGSDAHGLLRPDKLIVYAPDRTLIEALATRLAPELAGLDAQPVPFTAPVAPSGILSWGVDPSPEARLDGWGAQGERSWRLWVVKFLTGAMERQRRDAPDHPRPWAYALDRLRFEGVDPERWTPGAHLFRGGLAP